MQSDTKKTDVVKVFNYWQKIMNHPDAKLNDKNKAAINKAFKLNYTVEQTFEAIKGCANTPHNIGHNNKSQRYDSLSFILRDAKQIDRFIKNCHHPPRSITTAKKFARQNLLASQWQDLQKN